MFRNTRACQQIAGSTCSKQDQHVTCIKLKLVAKVHFKIRVKKYSLRPKKNDVLGFKICPKKNDVLLNLSCVHVHVGMQQ
jgi:hypothetical protein